MIKLLEQIKAHYAKGGYQTTLAKELGISQQLLAYKIKVLKQKGYKVPEPIISGQKQAALKRTENMNLYPEMYQKLINGLSAKNSRKGFGSSGMASEAGKRSRRSK